MTDTKSDRMELEQWPLAKLKRYYQNPRTHDPDQIAMLKASMLEFGWGPPILVRGETGTIAAGHGRLTAAEELVADGHGQFAEAPVIVRWGWSDAQFRAYVIADNRIAERGGWDQDLLSIELGELLAEEIDPFSIGFSESDLAIYIDMGTDGKTDPDDLPLPGENVVTRLGDTWLLGSHRLRCGDSTSASDVEALLDGRLPAIMITDPPYGVGYAPGWRAAAGINHNPDKMGAVLNDTRADWRAAWALFPGDVAYVWHAGKFAGTVQESLEANDFEVRSQIIWAKERFALSRGDYHWQHEPCWYAVRRGGKSGWQGSRKESTVWEIKAREDSGLGHGTQKPVECMKRPIDNNTVLSTLIYDPFVGSGTTIIAAEMTGRRCLAMELSPEYVDIVVRRWQAFTGREAVTESGETFQEVADLRASDAAA